MRMIPWTFAAALFLCAGPALAQTVGAAECTIECDEVREGYNWARSKGIGQDGACTGNSEAFNKGCRSYVEEQRQDAEIPDGYEPKEVLIPIN